MYQLPTLTSPLQHRLLRGGEALTIDIRSASVVRPGGAGQGISLGDAPAAQLTLTAGAGLHEGEEIAYQVGDGTNWVPIGVFTVLTADGTDGLYTYTCADAMAVSMESLWLPTGCTTAFEVLESIASQCGLTFYPGETASASSVVGEAVVGEAVVGGTAAAGTSGLTDVALTKAPAAGPTCRELAGQMAALFGGNAIIDRQGRLTVLVWSLDAAALAVTADETYSGETQLGADSHSVQSLTCTVETETTTTDEDGLTTTEPTSETLSAGTPGAPGISISNPYMTQSRLEAIYAGLQGRNYYSGSVGYIGHPELDPGDMIAVEDRAGTRYLFPVMDLSWELDGGLRSTAQSFAQSEAENQADYSGPTAQAVQRLTADLASFKQLYATNIRAEMGQFKSLITDDLNAVAVNASKYITGATIIGDLIKAGTLSAKKIILEGADGLFYELNAKAGTLTPEQLTDEQYQQRLDGSVLVANSVTADKINVTELFAQDITATGTIRGVTLEGAIGTFNGRIYSDSAIFSNGKQHLADGLAGVGLGPDMIDITSDGDPTIRFYRHNATSSTSSLSETADGVLAIRDKLTVGGFAVPQMQHGRVVVSVPADPGYSDTIITFATPFSGIPDVTVTPRHGSRRFDCQLTEISNTGFTVRCYSELAQDGNPAIHWTAMY